MSKSVKKRKAIKVCTGPCCREHKSKKIARLLEEELDAAGLTDTMCVKKCECLGKCKNNPVVLFASKDLLFEDVKPKDAAKMVKKIVAAL